MLIINEHSTETKYSSKQVLKFIIDFSYFFIFLFHYYFHFIVFSYHFIIIHFFHLTIIWLFAFTLWSNHLINILSFAYYLIICEFIRLLILSSKLIFLINIQYPSSITYLAISIKVCSNPIFFTILEKTLIIITVLINYCPFSIHFSKREFTLTIRCWGKYIFSFPMKLIVKKLAFIVLMKVLIIVLIKAVIIEVGDFTMC